MCSRKFCAYALQSDLLYSYIQSIQHRYKNVTHRSMKTSSPLKNGNSD
jgi:hypothetical protein